MKEPLALVIVCLCFFQAVCGWNWELWREYEKVLLSLRWELPLGLMLWCGMFVFLTFRWRDVVLIGLLGMGLGMLLFCGESRSTLSALVLLTGTTLGKGICFALKSGRQIGGNKKYLTGLIGVLVFASWWHLDLPGAYHGPRWMGLWNNPNIYGMLMGAGVVLSAGLLLADSRWQMADRGNTRSQKPEVRSQNQAGAANSKFKIQNSKLFLFLIVAVGIMVVGLAMSYSRGAWTATIVALLYLAWSYGKLKWRFVVPVVLVAAVVVAVFWHATADTDPWYLKRLDLSRPSAQHRVSAWRGAIQMMRDHPLGVGWNQAVSVYDKSYSPPEGGAAALTMNSYLMLGTELGLPGLVCFVAYVGLCFRRSPRLHLTKNLNLEKRIPHPGPLPIGSADSAEAETEKLVASHSSLRAACLAGALVFVVAFWFDGGLFDLPTAAMFWVLIELGVSRGEEG